jgi:SAM-dependent methyltransferase
VRKPWARLFEVPWVYRAWQAPFQEQKLAPILRHNDMSAVRRVLDVGCGPGTNAPHFEGMDYLGLDINPGYIAQANERYGTRPQVPDERHGMRFEVADVTRYQVRDEPFDFILVNSFFHHVGDDDSDRILAHLATLLTDDGRLHVLDLVLPPNASPSRLLARMDRGDFPRPLPAWRELLGRHFEDEVFEPYPLGVAGIPLWSMVYFRGRARRT